MASNSGYQGTYTALNGLGQFNQINFVVKQLLAKAHIATIVQVVAVNTGAEGPVGSVDVTPLVNMADGQGNAIQHGVIYNIPYMRLQGGANAIIIDPQVNDIGLAVFADQDISTVKSTKAAALPGSGRRNDWADGMYFGGFLNGTPNQYIEFAATGINVVTPGNLVMTVAGNLTANVTGSADVNAGAGINLVGSSGGAAHGCVQGDCLCAFTGQPHPMISGTVAASV